VIDNFNNPIKLVLHTRSQLHNFIKVAGIAANVVATSLFFLGFVIK